MGMNVIQPVTILDGNQYLVQGPADKTGQATSFDNVYNQQIWQSKCSNERDGKRAYPTS